MFSDSDSDFGQAAKSKQRARTVKSKVVADDWDSGSGDIDESGQSDQSDFELEDEAPKKKKITVTKKASAATSKKPSSRKQMASNTPNDDLPLQPVADSKVNGESVNGKPAPSNSNASSQYQMLSQIEHILKRPDTYIGSIEPTESQYWVYDSENKGMVNRNVTIVPGLYKIFDEILVNAADNKTRDSSMNLLEVTIDPENNIISVYNNGKGIPIEIHDKEKIYIPEMIFGNLLTSSNYNDDQKKVTGGRNGYGAKVFIDSLALFDRFTNKLSSFVIYFQQILRLKPLIKIPKKFTSNPGVIICPKYPNRKLIL